MQLSINSIVILILKNTCEIAKHGHFSNYATEVQEDTTNT